MVGGGITEKGSVADEAIWVWLGIKNGERERWKKRRGERK